MTEVPSLTGQDIGEAAEAVRALLDNVTASTGRSSSEFLALRVLALRGPITPPSALHDFLARQRQFGLDHAAITGLLARLEDEGLVSGTPDHQAGPARLTGEGHAVLSQLTAAVAAATSQLYAGIDPRDLATARHVLAQVTERARSLNTR
jgi:DNA-binding MarR family transcriptional regulator